MDIVWSDILKLLFAVLLGGLIGLEREFRDKTAGFRTVILICLGAALFTLVSLSFAPKADPARIAAQIVTGVGFLGAGAILRDGARIVGLTTAAIVWLAAAIGMATGSGNFVLAATATALIILVLWLFPKIEHWIDNLREVHSYEITGDENEGLMQSVEDLLRNSSLRVLEKRWSKENSEITLHCTLLGRPGAQQRLIGQLLTNPCIKRFTTQD